MVFYPNRVELCGVKILGDTGLGHSRRMLNMLRRKRNGRFARVGGEELAERIAFAVNAPIVINTITGCASSIRQSINKRLKRDLNVACEDQDVLVRDEQGYHLNDDRITVRFELTHSRIYRPASPSSPSGPLLTHTSGSEKELDRQKDMM